MVGEKDTTAEQGGYDAADALSSRGGPADGNAEASIPPIGARGNQTPVHPLARDVQQISLGKDGGERGRERNKGEVR